MRPNSILWFDRLYMGIVATNLATFLDMLPVMEKRLLSQPGAVPAGVGIEVILAVMVGSMIISLALWFFVSRFRSNIVKWLMVLLLGHSTITGFVNIATVTDLTLTMATLNLLHCVLSGLAILALFAPESRVWFKR